MRMKVFTVEKLSAGGTQIAVQVPASKSVTNRALLLAALSKGRVLLTGGALSNDTRAFLDCLVALGIKVERSDRGIFVEGCGGNIPNPNAAINVQSAGTAARFLTVALAFCGGDYRLEASEQMQKRPMDEAIALLRQAGVTVECLNEEGRFPFRLRSSGVSANEFSVNTDKSSQYASAFLMAAGVRNTPLTLTLTGSRTQGSYVDITLRMLDGFAVPYARTGNEITVFPAQTPPEIYAIEPDISGACYFYALSLLLQKKVLVYGVRENAMQGDRKFFKLLSDRGVKFFDTPDGLLADGSEVTDFYGFDEDMQDFSDQTLTVAALAPFATTPTVLRNVAHIRLQECDRMAASVENLNALGIPARADEKNIYITPASPVAGRVKTFDDHRVAMAFTLLGLKVGGVEIENPDCCKKTFDNFFELISALK